MRPVDRALVVEQLNHAPAQVEQAGGVAGVADRDDGRVAPELLHHGLLLGQVRLELVVTEGCVLQRQLVQLLARRQQLAAEPGRPHLGVGARHPPRGRVAPREQQRAGRAHPEEVEGSAARVEHLDTRQRPAGLDQALVLPVLHRGPVRVPLRRAAGCLRGNGVLVCARDGAQDGAPQLHDRLPHRVGRPARNSHPHHPSLQQRGRVAVLLLQSCTGCAHFARTALGRAWRDALQVT